MSTRHSGYYREPVRERSVGWIVLPLLAAFVTLSGAILAYYFLPHPELLFASDEKQPPGNRLVHITFEGSDFYVPQSILKRTKKPVLGSVRQIDIQIPWPYDHLSVISGRVEPTSDLRDWVLLTFEPSGGRKSPDERFATTDRYYFAGPPSVDASGLMRYEFRNDSPYGDLQVYVDSTEPGQQAVIRCDLKASSLGPILCERVIDATDRIVARVRFARSNLEEWRKIEEVAQGVIRALLRQGTSG